ncbi:hypothetical protein PCE1_004190 [Barthelona sp. PCE]
MNVYQGTRDIDWVCLPCVYMSKHRDRVSLVCSSFLCFFFLVLLFLEIVAIVSTFLPFAYHGIPAENWFTVEALEKPILKADVEVIVSYFGFQAHLFTAKHAAAILSYRKVYPSSSVILVTPSIISYDFDGIDVFRENNITVYYMGIPYMQSKTSHEKLKRMQYMSPLQKALLTMDVLHQCDPTTCIYVHSDIVLQDRVPSSQFIAQHPESKSCALRINKSYAKRLVALSSDDDVLERMSVLYALKQEELFIANDVFFPLALKDIKNYFYVTDIGGRAFLDNVFANLLMRQTVGISFYAFKSKECSPMEGSVFSSVLKATGIPMGSGNGCKT